MMAMQEKFDLKSASYEELADYLVQLGEPPFRAKQLYEWMHVKHVDGLDGMTNLPKSLREKLKEQCSFTVLAPVDVQISGQDGTRKYLFALADGNVVESVLMRYKHGNSVCISSQVGCRMGCRFCASTVDGLERNLTPAEMLEQIYRIGCDIGERISNVVVMGSGEPLDNYDNLLKFIHMLTDEHGLHMSQRNVTVSTCGLVEKIRELADEKLAITLALSLHAGADAGGKQI
jgi:23S rRNA (adenine2503-C2)-methyltransferase